MSANFVFEQCENIFETLTIDERLLISLFLVGLFVFVAVALLIRKTPKGDGDGKVRRAVEDFERQDPPGDSPFIQLVARVNAVESEQHKMRKDIERIRIFKEAPKPQKEEAS